MDQMLGVNLAEHFTMLAGTHISSHSWWKTGALALAVCGASLYTPFKLWGMWKSTPGVGRYVNLQYPMDSFFMQLYAAEPEVPINLQV
jgi:hypothetical protein